MARTASTPAVGDRLAAAGRRFASPAVMAAVRRRLAELLALILVVTGLVLGLALASYDPGDPSFSTATAQPTANLAGSLGAHVADLMLQGVGYAAFLPVACLMTWAWRLATHRGLAPFPLRLACLLAAMPLLAATLMLLPLPADVPAAAGPGGAAGPVTAQALLGLMRDLLGPVGAGIAHLVLAVLMALLGFVALGLTLGEWRRAGSAAGAVAGSAASGAARLTASRARQVGEHVPPGLFTRAVTWPFRAIGGAVGGAVGGVMRRRREREMPLSELLRNAEALVEDAPPAGPAVARREPSFGAQEERAATPAAAPAGAPPRGKPVAPRVAERAAPPKPVANARQGHLDLPDGQWRFPPLSLLAAPPARRNTGPSEEALQGNARMLETVLEDYGVRGRIAEIRPGPVVTLYELEPAPGTKSARVIGLADDIARSMSVTAVRIATVPGRNVIGIELPNAKREMVYFSEMMMAEDWHRHQAKLPLALGKDIGGAPVIADLARMPHLLIAGTTGSGKSVGINTMILSLLYRFTPDECRFIMIDPKMLELSVYDRIPHLLAPVVTEPAKAIGALKWTVREMEKRYRAMSQLGVRNIGGYNEKVSAARARGEVLTRRVQVGFDPETNKPLFEDQPLALEPLPMIVVVIDEMADLMIVAGKDIEAAVQRLAQMARAAGIHVIMATQRPSVDVITGTIKANFPTRISFQVTSKIDSRTILGEMGAEQLLGQGDMLHMAGGGRVSRVHGPFVTDEEVEAIVAFLREQAEPSYIEEVTEVDEEGGGPDLSGMLGGNTDGEASLYDQAVELVTREGKASTSFVQRHLNIGYNRAAKLIEQMEKNGVVGAANHVGKREVLAPGPRD
ncbi:MULTISPECIES: DNA translocase FtsK [Roseomonadaceae]|uniref:DNA translocase FtsK 4TM domain-containing protein n=1 Tax=Falsiroseomonas oleicola TaxID=2801474 RepID=A0ABS6H274_9PROT|nr:DNA translocase FtsK [Roseomonas oleicola]MBU8542760.1 DNA translocase FtsK 4TM domain-containing protein [Roseomonas oleicola]